MVRQAHRCSVGCDELICQPSSRPSPAYAYSHRARNGWRGPPRARLAKRETGMNEQKIRERAYALWQQEGCPHGRDTEYWLRAEAELLDGPDAPKGIYVQTATGSASEPWVLTRGYAGSAASQQQRLVAKASPLWTLAEKGVLHPWAMVTDVDAPLAKLAAQLRPPFSPCVRTEAAIHAKIGRMRKMQRTAAAPQIKPVAF